MTLGRVPPEHRTPAPPSSRLLDPPVLSRNAVRRDETLRTDADRQLRGWPTARLRGRRRRGAHPGRVGPGDGPTAALGRWTDGSGARLRTGPTTGDAPPEDAVLLGEADGVGVLGGARRRRREAARRRAASVRRGSRTGRLGRPAHRRLRARRPGRRPVHHRRRRAELARRRAVLPARRLADRTRRAAGWHRRLRGPRPRGVPAHRPGGDLPGARRRRPGAARPPADLAARAGSRCWPGSSRRASRWRPAWPREIARGGRRPRSPTSATWAARPGRSRGRSWSASTRVADPDVPLRPADGEIAEARWVTRAELRAALAHGDWGARRAAAAARPASRSPAPCWSPGPPST